MFSDGISCTTCGGVQHSVGSSFFFAELTSPLLSVCVCENSFTFPWMSPREMSPKETQSYGIVCFCEPSWCLLVALKAIWYTCKVSASRLFSSQMFSWWQMGCQLSFVCRWRLVTYLLSELSWFYFFCLIPSGWFQVSVLAGGDHLDLPTV